MADQRILIATSPGEHRLARLRGGRLVAYDVERPSRPELVGALCHARVTAIATALAGAFVAIGGGESAFLPASEAAPGREDGAAARPIGTLVHVGQAIAVRVTRAPMGGKGARATARIADADRDAAQAVKPPAIVGPGPGPIARWLAGATPGTEILLDGPDLAASLRGRFPLLDLRMGTSPLFNDALEEEIEGLVAPDVVLPRGGRLRIAITPAATTIDVDTGGAGGGSARAEREAANRAALAEAARQVSLRGLAGNIVIDLAGLPGGKGGRAALLETAEAGFGAWVPDARVLGFSRLGLLEVVRPRIHPPLADVLGRPAEGVVLSPLSHALAAFRAALRVASEPGAVPRLVASPGIVAAARDETAALAALAARAGRPLAMVEDPSLPDARWRVEDARGR